MFADNHAGIVGFTAAQSRVTGAAAGMCSKGFIQTHVPQGHPDHRAMTSVLLAGPFLMTARAAARSSLRCWRRCCSPPTFPSGAAPGAGAPRAVALLGAGGAAAPGDAAGGGPCAPTRHPTMMRAAVRGRDRAAPLRSCSLGSAPPPASLPFCQSRTPTWQR